MQRTLICLIVLLCLFSLRFHAVPAYPKKISVPSENGEPVFITLKGDEHCKWAVSEEGYTLLPDSSGWKYAQEDVAGFAVPSSFCVSPSTGHTAGLKEFLSKQRKDIYPRPVVGDRENRVRSGELRAPITGNRKALIILMSFKDLDFIKTYGEFDALFNQPGYSDDGAEGSVHDYFMQASYNQLNFACDILGPYKANNNMSYYGGNTVQGNDKNPMELFKEAIQQAAQEVDLSTYDANNDGYVDNVHIIFAGYGEEAGASANAVWSHEATFEYILVQGMKIGGYSCAPELRGNRGNGISRIGPHCHEMGHALGAMDFYDTDYNTGGKYEGTGNWDIMAAGSWNNDGISPANFNPYVKVYDFGWANIRFLPENDYLTIRSSTENKDQIYRMDTSVDGEYFLLENRRATGFDKALPGEGLLVYHIHKDIKNALLQNKVNAAHPQKCYAVCASSNYSVPTSFPSSYGNINSAGCPFPGNTAKRVFDDTTAPSGKCWNGNTGRIKLSAITLNDDKTVTFYSGMKKEETKIWSDGFENNDFFSSWTIIQEQGNCTWQRCSTQTNDPFQIKDELTLLFAAEGENYVCMKNKSPAFTSESSKSLLVMPFVPLRSDAVYTMQFQYRHSAILNVSGRLTVLYRLETDEEWKPLASYTDLSSSWITKELILPSIYGKYQLAFRGELTTGGIYLDDIQLRTEDETAISILKNDPSCYYDYRAQAINIYAKRNSTVSIFSINGGLYGNRRLTEGKNMLKLPAGIYVIVNEDQKTKITVP